MLAWLSKLTSVDIGLAAVFTEFQGVVGNIIFLVCAIFGGVLGASEFPKSKTWWCGDSEIIGFSAGTWWAMLFGGVPISLFEIPQYLIILAHLRAVNLIAAALHFVHSVGMLMCAANAAKKCFHQSDQMKYNVSSDGVYRFFRIFSKTLLGFLVAGFIGTFWPLFIGADLALFYAKVFLFPSLPVIRILGKTIYVKPTPFGLNRRTVSIRWREGNNGSGGRKG